MDSQPGLASKRITLSWYPGRPAPPRPSANLPATGATGARAGNQVGYWGRIDTQGDFEEGSGFLAPGSPSRWPGRVLLQTVRRTLPLALAALVGAVTALAWQSHLQGAGKLAPVRAAAPAAANVTPARAPSSSPPEPLPAAHPQALPAPPAARPATQPLLGAPTVVAPARPSASPPRPAKARTRPATQRPAGAAAADPDAILQPTFM
jgi:hypothetical protein